MIKKDNQTIDKVYKGNTEIAKIYKGTDLVFQNYYDRIVAGTDLLALNKAKANSLEYLKAFGKCEQKDSELPIGYTRLEYLESTGTQYIDTGVIPNNVTGFSTKVSLSDVTSDGIFIGCRQVSSSNTRFWGAVYKNYAYFGFNNNYSAATSFKVTADTPFVANLNFYNDRTCYIDSYQPDQLSDISTTFTYSLIMFGRNNAGNIIRTSSKFYFCKITQGTELIRDFVPAKRNSDNTLGMYDLVNNVFYTNVGTGEFIEGPEITPSPTNIMPIWCNNGELKVRHKSGLPLGYTKLETISSNFSDANTYITTDVYWDYSKDYQIKGSFINPTSKKRKMLIGSFTSDNIVSNSLEIAADTNNNNKFRMYFQIQSSSSNTSTNAYSSSAIDINTFATYDFTYTASTKTATVTIKYGTSTTTGTVTLPSNYTGVSQNPYRLFLDYRQNSSPIQNPVSLGIHEIYVDGVLVRKYIPCKNRSNEIGMYETVAGEFKGNEGTGSFIAGSDVVDDIEVYIDGTAETIEDSLNNTATAENLLSVATYKDVQDVLSGEVTRNVGIMILDGTENWAYSAGYSNTNYRCYYLSSNSKIKGQTLTSNECLCSHFTWFSRDDMYNDKNFSGGSITGANTSQANGRSLTLRVPSSITQTFGGFSQWLEYQYNAGTPVIVVYPLQTPTTETVTEQQLNLQKGNNTIQVTQASLDELELEAKYKSKLKNNISNDFTFRQLDKHTFNEIKKMTF